MHRLLLILPLILCSCAGGMQARLDNARDSYWKNDYAAVAKQKDFAKQDNLELLMTADALFHANKFSESDKAFEEFNRRNINPVGFDAGREAGALLGGNLANSYRPYMMDLLFVSYYQIWDALADGRFSDARVVINQSYARQQNMSDEYARLIEKNQTAKNAGREESELAAKLHEENSHWAAFRDIMNPALMHLSGIFFLNSGKFEDAKTYLKRASGMMPENSFIKEDLAAAQSGETPDGIAWIFIETGMAPKLREGNIHLPWMAKKGIGVTSIAVSEPVFFKDTMMIDGAQMLADVDAMFMTEYKEYRVNEALRALAFAVSKTALQAAMYNSSSKHAGLMGLASTIYSIASTSAEVRSWATLPQHIWVLRAKNDKGLISIKSNASIAAEIEIPKTGNHLVYVRFGKNAYDLKVVKLR